jgi:DNA-binding protein HU-beta
MNKQELVKAVAGKTELTQVAVNKVLNALEEQVVENLQSGEKTQLTGFITVKPVYRAARKGFDPIKKEAMDIQPTVGVSAKAGEKLRKAVESLNVADFAPVEVAE